MIFCNSFPGADSTLISMGSPVHLSNSEQISFLSNSSVCESRTSTVTLPGLILISQYKWLWLLKNSRNCIASAGLTDSDTTWPLYSNLRLNFTITRSLLSAGLRNILQLTLTYVTVILQILLFIFSNLILGITLAFLNKIFLDKSSPSSLSMLWNGFVAPLH